MKQKIQRIRTVALGALAVIWWGLWYPELAAAADTYVIVYEDGTVVTAKEVWECGLAEYSCEDLMEIDGDQIRFRSKLWETMEEYMIKVRSGNDNGKYEKD